jgi:hypothetical protein
MTQLLRYVHLVVCFSLQATANWLEQLLPFLYLLLVVFITQHSLGALRHAL